MSENNEQYDRDVEQAGAIKVQAKLSHHTTMLGGIARIGKVVEMTAEDQKEPLDGMPRVLVQIGGSSKGSYVRNWMPWTTIRAGCDGEWWAPELDEQVLVIAPSGNLTQGIIVGSLFRGALTFDANAGEAGEIVTRDPIPSATEEGAEKVQKHIHKRIYKDGSNIIYDRNRHKLSMVIKSTPKSTEITSIDLVADESLVFNAGTTQITIKQNGAVEIDAGNNDVTIVGNVNVTGTMDVRGA